jgi:hypothetical protein
VIKRRAKVVDDVAGDESKPQRQPANISEANDVIGSVSLDVDAVRLLREVIADFPI